MVAAQHDCDRVASAVRFSRIAASRLAAMPSLLTLAVPTRFRVDVRPSRPFASHDGHPLFVLGAGASSDAPDYFLT
jgi:hypothetical protein